MPNLAHTIKTTFAGGEYAPSLWGRVDIARYATGARKLRNFIVSPHGGVSNRPGTHYQATAKYGNKKCRLIPFKFSSLQNYILEFGDYYIRFYTQDGQLLVAPGGLPYEVVSPYAEADLPLINFTQSADVLFMGHPDFQPRQLNRMGSTNWTITLYDFIGGPFMLANVDANFTISASAVTGNGITLYASNPLFQTTQIGALFQLRHYIQGQAVTDALASVTTTSSIKCGGTWRIITHGTWTGKIQIEKSTDNGANWTVMRNFSSAADYNANTFGTEDMSNNAEPFLIRVNMTAYTSGTCNVDLSSDAFYQQGIAKITAYVSATQVTVDVKRTFGDTIATIDWSEGSWSDYRGWPATVEFSPGDRLIFASTYSELQTYWMTKVGNYYDFSRSSPLVDSDGISTNLPSRELNAINGLVPLTEIIALTSSAECSIEATTAGILTPLTVMNKIHGYEGSFGIRPVVLGNRAIYVQAMGSIMRDLGYELSSNSFQGADISVMANHLFTGYTITDMAYQQNPNRIVWCVRSDGILLSMTYMREQEVLAWTWHDTDGKFESVACIPYNGYNEVWVVVQRGTNRFIERMDNRMSSTAVEDQFFVDCGITYDGTPASVIGSLSHLEGKTVAILADGNVMPQQIVVNGTITLDNDYSVVQVGLPYFADLETLNIEVGLADGTMQGRKVKISKLIFRFLQSRGGWIGPDENTLYEVMDNYRSIYSLPIALYTGDQPETLGAGYESGGRIFFRQIDPLPVTILAIMPLVSIGGTTLT